ncbi:MAG: GNAT family N-acetyltransferase [Gaiellaceae bacterium]|jgi:[ribosomal protein S5]-alanine N-acetyltransferase
MRLDGRRLYLRPLAEADAEALLHLYVENRSFFAARESTRGDDYYTLDRQLARIAAAQTMLADDKGALFGSFGDENDELLGFLGLFGVLRGDFQEARIGYMFGERQSGRGYATEAVELALRYAFETLALHRLETGVQLDNPASMRVLTKTGFREEGVSPRWVKIGDGWADCKRFALTREEWGERSGVRLEPG